MSFTIIKKKSTNVSCSCSCRTWACHYMQLLLIFGTAINKFFDAISQLSINHLASNKNNCFQMSKPWSISMPFVAITNSWCLYRLWQHAMTAKYVLPRWMCVCQMCMRVRTSGTKWNVSVTAQQALNTSEIHFALMYS